MAAIRTAAEEGAPDQGELLARLEAEGLGPPRRWSNDPGDRYGWHDHPYHKVLYCLRGTIAFHLRDGDIALGAGDRLDVEPGTEHAATVGPDGVECFEAARP